ncbi:MAG: hypothetical protein GW938_08340 [Leptospira sp.]|nr:hypothetical protein [Leptospira sp.]
MNSFRLSITFLFLIIYSSTIWSDIVILKSGKTIEGKFIETNSNYTVIDNFDRKIRIQNNDIDSMEVGYSGISICYQLKDQDENCNAKLHLLSQGKVVLVSGKGYLEVLELDSSDFLNIKGNIDPREDSITKHIRTGIGLEIIDGNSNSIKGKLISISEDAVLTLESEDSEIILVSDKEIKSFSYYSPAWFHFPKSDNLVQIVPGLPQFYKGDTWKGTTLMSLGALTFVGAIFEYNNAQKSASSQVTYIPVGSQLVATSAFNNSKSFEMHKQNFQILTAGFLLIYIYHFYDLYANYPEPENQTFLRGSRENNYFHNFSFPENQGPFSIWNYGNSQYLEYSLQF